MAPGKIDRATLAAEVAARQWYHAIELAPGVVTPGWLDTRSVAHAVPLPPSLSGKRCLDVGTFNGFWAFEMERRGAAEVIGVDVLDPEGWDWPVGSDPQVKAAIARRHGDGRGFEIVKRQLGSSVERLERSIYDLDEGDIGRFDVVYVGSLLVHLRDPIRALERVRAVCDGTLVVVDGVDLFLSLMLRRPVAALDGRGRPWWWWANTAGLARMIESAGFEITTGPKLVFIPPGPGWAPRRLRPSHLTSREGRQSLVGAWKGDPHAMVAARPRPLG